MIDWSLPPPTEIDALAQPNSWSRARRPACARTCSRARCLLSSRSNKATDTRKKNFDNPTFKTGQSDAGLKHAMKVKTDFRQITIGGFSMGVSCLRGRTMLPQTRGWSCNARALTKSHVITDCPFGDCQYTILFSTEWASFTGRS